jgi:CRP/FNR family transcriptional regulator, anaerobic regulatory protein
MQNQLLNIISQKVALPGTDIELCKHYSEPVLFPKNRIIENKGKIRQYLCFIVTGFMRLFHYNTKYDKK